MLVSFLLAPLGLRFLTVFPVESWLNEFLSGSLSRFLFVVFFYLKSISERALDRCKFSFVEALCDEFNRVCSVGLVFFC